MENDAIAVCGVSVVRDGVSILNHVDFSVKRREKVIIAGENGAGKTTLLKTILGLVPVSQGAIDVLDVRVGSRQWRRLRSRVGYVNQESIQVDFPISAREVVEVGLVTHTRRGRRGRALAAMAQTGTAELEHRDYRVLSGGEKQRVSIARCLAQEAEVLLLDEPGAFLDSEARADVVAIIDRLNEESRIAVLLVTHQPEEVADDGFRLLKLEDGSLRNGR